MLYKGAFGSVACGMNEVSQRCCDNWTREDESSVCQVAISITYLSFIYRKRYNAVDKIQLTWTSGIFKAGRPYEKITEAYGRNAFEFRENSIVVTLPFNVVNAVSDNSSTAGGTRSLLPTRERVLTEIRNNPNVTQPQIAEHLRIGKTSVQKAIAELKAEEIIERIGSNKSGYWQVLK